MSTIKARINELEKKILPPAGKYVICQHWDNYDLWTVTIGKDGPGAPIVDITTAELEAWQARESEAIFYLMVYADSEPAAELTA